MLSETTATGALIAEYVFANGKLAAVVKPDGVYYYHTDPAGSPLAMTNKSKTVVWKADYRPFGEEQSKTLNYRNDRMFTGKEKDKETEGIQMMKLNSIIVIFTVTLFCCCGNAGKSVDKAKDLVGFWRLNSFTENDQKINVLDGTTITISFSSNNSVGGDSGCNGFSGSYDTSKSGNISLANIISTTRVCSLPIGIMEQEQAYLKAILSAMSYSIEGDRLTIRYDSDSKILNFDRDKSN